MDSQHSALTGNESESARLGALIAKLRTVRSAGLRDYWPAYGVGLCTAVVAAIEGKGFFAVYGGVLVLVFMLHDRSILRADRQIDGVLDALRKGPDTKQDRT